MPENGDTDNPLSEKGKATNIWTIYMHNTRTTAGEGGGGGLLSHHRPLACKAPHSENLVLERKKL